MMTENRLRLIVVIILVISGLLWYRSTKKSNEFPDPSELVGWRQSRATTRPSTPFKGVLEMGISKVRAGDTKKMKSKGPPSVVTVEPTVLEVCESGWLEIASTSERDLQNNLERGQRLLSVACLNKMKKDLKTNLVQNFVTNCQFKIGKKNTREIQDDCLPLIPPFRAFVIRHLRADSIDFGQMELADLANQLFGGFVELKHTPEEEIQRNIQIADAIITKDPDFYPAYKAKLLSLLVEELKFGGAQDLEAYQKLYDELLSFRGTNQQETILNEALLQQGQETPAIELADMDADLVHIPFLRLSTLNDIEGLAEMAQEYVDTYPNSYIGYMYLAEAAWKSGDQASAINIFKTVLGKEATDETVLNVLSRLQSKKPLELIMEMKL